MNDTPFTIIFSGGGTLGPVVPLLAVAEEIRARGVAAHFLWIGTERGVELPLVRKAGIETRTIPSGKLRRSGSFKNIKKNIADIFFLFKGFYAARALLREVKPAVVVTAGGYVSVPVHLAAWTLRIPQIVHQQDVHIGLANRIMSYCATRITVSLPEQCEKFGAKKCAYTGNPVRASVLSCDRAAADTLFRLDPDRATVFAFGGGTGAELINHTIACMAEECEGQFQIIHVTGLTRSRPTFDAPWYHQYPFFTTEMAAAYAASDVVVARAGFNTISEIAAWGRPAILIPIHGSHQEENAKWAAARGAVIVLDEVTLSADHLLGVIRDLCKDSERYDRYAQAAHALFPEHAGQRVADEILTCAHHTR